jgi:hypothetical protein
MSNEKQKQNIRQRLAMIEKEIFDLSGNDRVKARTEYHRLLHYYSKECGLDEPIYLTRA